MVDEGDSSEAVPKGQKQQFPSWFAQVLKFLDATKEIILGITVLLTAIFGLWKIIPHHSDKAPNCDDYVNISQEEREVCDTQQQK